MYFFKRGGWQVQFLEADLKTPLPRKLTFTDSGEDPGACKARGGLGRLREPADAGGARSIKGRGGVLPEADTGAICETQTALVPSRIARGPAIGHHIPALNQLH